MDPVRDLVEEIKRLQLLASLYDRGLPRRRPPRSLETVSGALRICPQECGTIARHLIGCGLVEEAAGEERGPRDRLRLTEAGLRRVEAWRDRRAPGVAGSEPGSRAGSRS
jgi:DNA-binding MarR family transcriptional regulator